MRPKIIAVDFDGTLIPEGCFPGTGPPNEEVLNYCKAEQAKGARIILWTNREGEPLTTAVNWCEEHWLHLDAVNDNLPEAIAFFGNNCRKIYADEFIDDRAIHRFSLPYSIPPSKRIRPATQGELLEAYWKLYYDPKDPILDYRVHDTIPYAITVEHYSGFERDFYVVEETIL